MSREKILECKNISFKYFQNSKREVISDFSFSFEKGKIYLITGFSGYGKSSLAYILNGLYPNNKGILVNGEMLLEGKEIGNYSPPERAKKIMMMFQNCDTQFCMDRVKEEIIFTLENIGFPVEKMESRVRGILEELDILHLMERELFTLSGGEKQKVALACILAVEPKVILLDEPFANLDRDSSKDILLKLKKLNEEKNTTIIAIDHRFSLWENISKEVIYLEKGGKILENFQEKELRDNFQLKNLKKIYLEHEKKTEKKFVEIKDLKIKTGEKNIFKNFSMEIEEGKITALLGKSGLGKTTLLKTICGLQKYENGDIFIEGKNLKNIKIKKLMENIGIIFQNPQNQFVSYKVIDEIVFTLKRKVKEKEECFKMAEKLLEEFNLAEYKNYSPFALSQGQQRKLAVLSMICGGQKIILCDEPTYAQDNKTSREIMKFLKERCEKEGITIILVSHDTELMLEWADKIFEIERDGVREVIYERV